ncbi:hypothetical protein EA770_10460 [Acinetobacter baumannii]|nr:hypothetical protein EA770_10460 [Acinetobacter baumannii]
MNSLKLALIEDDQDTIDTFERSCKVYKRKQNVEIEVIKCRNLSDFKTRILDIIECDGLIVDMALTKASENEESGLEVIEYFSNNKIIIPTVIFTATEDPALLDHAFIDIMVKSEVDNDDIISYFFKIKSSAILDILGGKGLLKEYMYNVFHKNINKQKNRWIDHSEKNLDETKKALLRHTLNHLFQYLEVDSKKVFVEEMYIYPPISEVISPGCVVRKDNIDYLVLTPACDLIPRPHKEKDEKGNIIKSPQGEPKITLKPKTNCVLLAEIQSLENSLQELLFAENLSKNAKNIRKCLDKIFQDNLEYFHFLPDAFDFKGGTVLFRSITSIEPEKLAKEYSSIIIRISPFFLNNIQARFSRYYARQGQPDIDYSIFIEEKVALFEANFQ